MVELSSLIELSLSSIIEVSWQHQLMRDSRRVEAHVDRHTGDSRCCEIQSLVLAASLVSLPLISSVDLARL